MAEEVRSAQILESLLVLLLFFCLGLTSLFQQFYFIGNLFCESFWLMASFRCNFSLLTYYSSGLAVGLFKTVGFQRWWDVEEWFPSLWPYVLGLGRLLIAF